MVYWFHQVFLPRVNSSIQVGFSYVLYNILLPNVTNDVLLIMVTTEYIDALMESCARYSASAASQTQKFLRIAFKDAICDGYIKANPMEEARKYWVNIPRIQILTKEEIKILLAAASQNQTLYLEVLLALFCGLRKGEILGLQFTDLNVKERTLHVQRQMTRNYHVEFPEKNAFSFNSVQSIKPPKSANSDRIIREVPEIIFTELQKRIELIDFWKEKYADRYDHQNDDFIMVSHLGSVKSESTLGVALKALCKRNGLPHVKMHGLRHMFATLLIELGMPLQKISRLLGHQSVHTTFEVYCGIMEGRNEIGDFVDEAFDPGYAQPPSKGEPV